MSSEIVSQGSLFTSDFLTESIMDVSEWNTLEEAIRRVAAACSQQKAVAHYQMFRSPRTKERILGEISAKQIDFFDLLAVS